MKLIQAAIACCLLCAPQLAASDYPDPYANLHPQHNLEILRHLRAPLADQPHDQVLLGVALQAMVNLSLHGHPNYYGWAGPWHDYAIELAQHRAELRNGQRPETFAAALPELWCDAMRGDYARAAERLDAWGEAATSIHGLALRAYITRDYRLLDDQPNRPPHAEFALAHSSSDSRRENYRYIDPLMPGQWPVAIAFIKAFGGQRSNSELVATELFRDIIAMLSDPQLAEDRALPALKRLAATLQLNMKGVVTRQKLQQALLDKINALTPAKNARLYAISYTICKELVATGDRGLREHTGQWKLGGLADQAQWLRDRSIVTARYLVRSWYSASSERDKFCDTLSQLVPGSMLGAYPSVYRKADDDPAQAAMQRATTNELKDPHGVSLTILSTALDNFEGNNLYPVAQAWRKRYLTNHQNPTLSIPNGLFENIYDKGHEGFYSDLLQAQIRLDPWNHRESLRTSWYNPRVDWLTFNGFKPILEWIMPTVQFPNLTGLPEALPRTWWAARIDGEIRIDTPGHYNFSLTADDSARLRIGDLVIMNSVRYRMRTRQGSMYFESGTYPMCIEWYQGPNTASLQLTWRPPDTQDDVVIPADHLSHNGSPGLRAQVYQDDVSGHRVFHARNPTRLAMAKAMPYAARLNYYVAESLREAGQPEEAFAVLRPALAINPKNDSLLLQLAAAHLVGDQADLQKTLAIYKQVKRTNGAYGIANRLLSLARQDNVQQQTLDQLNTIIGQPNRSYRSDNYLMSQLQIDTGNFAEAQKRLEYNLRRDRIFASWDFRMAANLGHVILSRMYNRDFSQALDHLADEASKNTCPPLYQDLADYLSGEIAFTTLLAFSKEEERGDVVYYFGGLKALSQGEHERAKEYFAKITAYDWPESASARSLLAWYEQQTPQNLAKLPKAKWPAEPAAGAPSTNDNGPLPPPLSTIGAEDF